MEELQATQEELARRQKEYDRSNWTILVSGLRFTVLDLSHIIPFVH
jgi:hypothetical protein